MAVLKYDYTDGVGIMFGAIALLFSISCQL